MTCDIVPSVHAEPHHSAPLTRAALVLEDDAVQAHLVRHWLTLRGFDVTVAPDCGAAVKALRAEPGRFALVVSDIDLPDGSGLTLWRELRPYMPTLRLLCMSARPVEAMPTEELVGFDGYLAKPFRRDELDRRLATIGFAAALP